jgi:hypothetical protein
MVAVGIEQDEEWPMSAEDEIIPDFRNVKNFAEIQRRFILSARSIMHGHILALGGNEFVPTSLELYLKLHDRRDVWWDSATDKDDVASYEQCKRGTWYVRQKKGQQYWRIDITAGNADERIQAGILIRQLDGRGGLNPGPAIALHRIVRGKFEDAQFDDEQMELIRQIHGKRIDGTDGSPLILKKRKETVDVSLAKGKRFNVRKSDAQNCEGIVISEAALRVSAWRKYSYDTIIDDDVR